MKTEALLHLNPAPWDAVPLRLLLDLGIERSTLQRLRFADFDPIHQQVSFARGRQRHALQIEDDTFWTDFEKLRACRHATPEHYVFPADVPRKYNPSPAEIRAMEIDGMLDGGTKYLWHKPGGRWMRSTIDPTKHRDGHGAMNWWYRCLERAEVVAPGTRTGHPMSKARHTVGRSALETGSVKDLQRRLGVSSGGSASVVYSNRDADQLEATIRKVRPQLRPPPQTAQSTQDDGSANPASETWWREPIARLVDYIEEERDLVELSRVSIEMLRSQPRDSEALRNAARTLTRVVNASKLIDRAQAESTQDHPLLHGHSLVAIWGAMETMAMDVVIAWLTHQRAARMTEKVAQIKVSYSMFEDLPPEDPADAVAHQLDRQQDLRAGINRFEQLLDAVDLSGQHDPILAKNIYAMQQIRHVFAHKSGTADGPFVDACPHLGYAVGDPIHIDRNTWSDFMVNAVVYAEVVLRRMKTKLGLFVEGRPMVINPIRNTRASGHS